MANREMDKPLLLSAMLGSKEGHDATFFFLVTLIFMNFLSRYLVEDLVEDVNDQSH